MKPFRFLHAADLHLDSPFKGLTGLPEAVRGRIRESTFAALSRLVSIAVRERVDFVVVSGDVYDLSDRSLRAQLRFQQAAETLADNGIPLFVIHGNHDPLDGARARLTWPESVVFFGADDVRTVTVKDRDGVAIASVSGISYGKAATTDNLAALFPKPESNLYAIAMLHTNVDGDEGHDNYAPCTKEQLVRSGYDYWALGHIHSRRVLHESPFIVYPGNIQGRNVKETGAKGCYVARVDAAGHTHMEFHSTEAVRWEQREVSIQGWTDEQQLKNGLERVIAEVQADNGDVPTVLRLTLTGRGPLHKLLQEGLALQELLAELCDEQLTGAGFYGKQGPFVWIESCRVETGAEIDIARLLQQETFIGDLLRMSEKLLEDDVFLQQFTESATASLMSNAKAAKLLKNIELERFRQWILSARELAVDELLGEERGAG